MTNKKRQPDNALANLEDWLDDETLSMSVEELKEELKALGDDPESIPEKMRALARSVAQRGGTDGKTDAPSAVSVKSVAKADQTPRKPPLKAAASQSKTPARPNTYGQMGMEAMKMAAKGKGGSAGDPLGSIFDKDIVINGHKFSASIPPTKEKNVILRGELFDPAWQKLRIGDASYDLQEVAPNAKSCVGLKKLRFQDALKEHRSGKSVMRFE